MGCSPAAGSHGLAGREEKAGCHRHFLWPGGTESCRGGAAQQGKWQGREQCLSQQMLDRAQGSAMQLSTVDLGGGVSEKETKPQSPGTPKTYLSLPSEMGPIAYYL